MHERVTRLTLQLVQLQDNFKMQFYYRQLWVPFAPFMK